MDARNYQMWSAASLRKSVVGGLLVVLFKWDVRSWKITLNFISRWLTVFEKRAIQATAAVQAEVGCGVSFHPGRDKGAPEEIARIYLEAGGAKEKCVLSHLDRTLHTKEEILRFAELGLYCQYDLFGQETSAYQLNSSVDMPSDAQRVDRIKWLIEDGRENNILVAHDIHTKHRLVGT